MSQKAKLSLSTKDVIHIEGFQENASLFKNESTLRIHTILQQLRNACTASGMGVAEVTALLEQGIPCEVLQPGANDWQSGHLRLSIEFQPGLLSSSVTMQDSSVSSNVVSSNVVSSNNLADPIGVAAPSEVLKAVPEATPEIDFGNELDTDLSDDFDLGSDLDMSHEMDTQASLDENLMDDLDDTFGSAMDLGGFGDDELLGVMPDTSLEESMNSDLDLSDLSDMDSMDGGLGEDDLSFDMDSQAVETGDLSDLGDLSSPWDLSDDLDEMLLTNNHL